MANRALPQRGIGRLLRAAVNREDPICPVDELPGGTPPPLSNPSLSHVN